MLSYTNSITQKRVNLANHRSTPLHEGIGCYTNDTMPRVSKKVEQVVTVERRERRITPAFIAGLTALTLVVIGGAVFLGRSDSGAINVSATIGEANQVASQNGGEQVPTINQTFQDLPNGGLVPAENQQAPVPEPEPQNTSTTTDTVATSTPADGVSDTQGRDANTNEAGGVVPEGTPPTETTPSETTPQ